jgi:hypothetical protein
VFREGGESVRLTGFMVPNQCDCRHVVDIFRVRIRRGDQLDCEQVSCDLCMRFWMQCRI